MSLIRFNSNWTLAFLTVSACLDLDYIPPRCNLLSSLSLLPPFLCFLLMFLIWSAAECSSMQTSLSSLNIFLHVEMDCCGTWRWSFNITVSSGPSSLQGFIQWDSSKQTHEESPVCLSEIQNCDLAFFPSSIPSQYWARLWWSLQPRLPSAFTVRVWAEHLFLLFFRSLGTGSCCRCSPRSYYTVYAPSGLKCPPSPPGLWMKSYFKLWAGNWTRNFSCLNWIMLWPCDVCAFLGLSYDHLCFCPVERNHLAARGDFLLGQYAISVGLLTGQVLCVAPQDDLPMNSA